MKFLPITEVCDFQGGTQPPKNEWSDKPLDGYIRMLQIRDFTQSDRTTPEFVKNSKKLKTCSSDDVLIGRYGASIGKILTGLSGAYNVAIVKTIPNEKLLSKNFLLCLLRSPSFQNFITTIGARAAQAGFNKSDLTQFNIPVLPLNDQIRIAHLLGKVEGLIVQRKQHLQQLDDLLKSVFLEMFGDPVRNERGWEKKPCNTVAEITTGHPFKSDLYTTDPTQLRLCGGLIIYPHGIDWDKCNYWPEQLLTGLERYLLETNDIVLAMDRPWISSGLKICTVDEIGCGSLLVQRTARLRAKDIDQYFLYAHLKDSSFTKHCKPTETTVPHISIKDIQTFQVLCPPKPLQSRFALIAAKVEALKSRYQQSLSDLESLYGTLSQQAFKGELDLSQVPLPDSSTGAQNDSEAMDEVAIAIPEAEASAADDLTIQLPESNNLPGTLTDKAKRKDLFAFWLESYCQQIDSTPFSASDFLAAVQTRIAELHPDNEFELDLEDYDQIKNWVFEALNSGRLQQAQNVTGQDENGELILGNKIELKAGIEL